MTEQPTQDAADEYDGELAKRQLAREIAAARAAWASSAPFKAGALEWEAA